MLEHEDGSTTSLHPQWSKTKVACTFAESPVDFEVPRSGPGGTSGPGNFNQFKNKHIDQWLKFDAQKKPPTPAVAEPKEGATTTTTMTSGAEPQPQSRQIVFSQSFKQRPLLKSWPTRRH